MRDGFVKVAAGTPKIRVADCRYNAEQIFTMMREADKQGVRVLCLPELCLTGYTCGDLFLQDTLLRGAEEGLNTILEATRNLDLVTAVGLPVRDKWDGKLYNCAALIQQGEILGLVPKVHLPNYGEFYEKRWFASGKDMDNSITLCGQEVCLSDRMIWACEEVPDLVIGVEICEDLWAPEPPSAALARSGATLILNLSASNETVGKANYRRNLVAGQSGRLLCGYVYADAGEGESTTDLVFSGHNIIAENGSLLAERRFAAGLTVSEIDVQRLAYERRRNTTFTPPARDPMAEAHCLGVSRVSFNLKVGETKLTRYVSPNPFVPADAEDRAERCNEILKIAALGLKKRLEHTRARTAVVGLSGGLDSTLAILITAVAMKLLDRPESDIIAVTMPCFGTTDRTRDNAVELAGRFAGLEARPHTAARAAAYVPGVVVKKKAIEQNHLTLAFPGLSFADPRRFQLQLLSSILGGGMSSRLFQQVREQKGLCYSIYSYGTCHDDTGYFGVYTALGRETEGQALDTILAVIREPTEHGVTQAELDRAREQSKANVIMGLESTQARMSHAGRSLLFSGEILTPEAILAAYDAVTREDVMALARDLFQWDQASLSAVGQVRPAEAYRALVLGA